VEWKSGEEGSVPFFGDGEMGPHLTQSHHTKWYLNPSGHLATTDMAKNWRALTLWGGEGVARAQAYLHAKFHLDPSNRLVTVR